MSRKQSVGRLQARKQSASGPAIVEHVNVAVLPPRVLSERSCSEAGLQDMFGRGESFGPSRRKSSQAERTGGRKGLLERFTRGSPSQPPIDSDKPPFIFRTVPYDTWRKHYAKDKDGKYQGTHAPAEDCLLKPDDVLKWRLGEATGQADRWTRGSEVLPVYAEVQALEQVPDYEVEHDEQPRVSSLSPEEDGLASYLESRHTATRSHNEINLTDQWSISSRSRT